MDVLTNVLALDDAIGNGATETFPSLLFVTVVASTVEETVTRLDGVVHSLQSWCCEWAHRHAEGTVHTSAQVDLVTWRWRDQWLSVAIAQERTYLPETEAKV